MGLLQEILLFFKMSARLISTCVASSASAIPTDVKFQFKEEEEDGSETVKEIKAHKFILALVSDVFRMGFYGGFPCNGCVDIVDVKKESFEVMIDYIYNKGVDLGTYDLDMLCTLYCLGDKYNINILVEESLEKILSKNISAKNIIHVCLLADQYSIHDKLVDTLYGSAAQSLSKILGDKLTLAKVSQFFSQITADTSASPSAMTVVRILGKVKKPTVCGNCKATPCKSGTKVSKDNFVNDAEIKLVSSVSMTGKAIAKLPEFLDADLSSFYFMKAGANTNVTKSYSVHYNEGQTQKMKHEEDYEYVFNC